MAFFVKLNKVKNGLVTKNIGLEQDGIMIGPFHIDSSGIRDFANHPVDDVFRKQKIVFG